MEGSSARESGLRETLPEKTIETLVPQVEVSRDVRPAPPRYRNEIAKYIIRRSSRLQTLREMRGGLSSRCARVETRL